jgi:hypothetical protein
MDCPVKQGTMREDQRDERLRLLSVVYPDQISVTVPLTWGLLGSLTPSLSLGIKIERRKSPIDPMEPFKRFLLDKSSIISCVLKVCPQ